DKSEINTDIIERTKRAIDQSDLLIWLIEYDRTTEFDDQILKILRDTGAKDVVLVANKADNEQKVMESYSQAGLGGFETFFPVSVSHNAGMREVKKYVSDFLQKKGLNYQHEEIDEDYIKLSLVGRPNVGKSSLINAAVGRDRVMVKDMSGTTRDSIDTSFNFEGEKFVLIDTAGIRRLSKVGVRNIEDWSVMRTNRAITRSDVVAVVIDGIEGVVHWDLSIISKVLEEKKGLIVVVNKWDEVLKKALTPRSSSSTSKPESAEEVKNRMMNRYISYLKEKVEFLPWASVVFTSAVENKRVDEILENAVNIKKERHKRVKTGVFNNFLEQVVYKHPPTGNKKSHNPKMYYGAQVDTNPPKFVITVNNPDHFHFSYKRYLENRIRDNFGFFGTPIIIEFKGRGKYADKVK
ncbi:ribosome biogenesis GTPase Der, partial [Candidatus Gracilibacteria bacterium]|nr:ribosome biogenesis GTPase Der [Candidatus Gracilibacteria bacterium]